MAESIDELVSVGFVARRAGWRKARMLRRLKALDLEAEPKILQDVGRASTPRWMVGLKALRQAWPGLFTEDLATMGDRVSKLEDRADDATRQREMLAAEVARCRKRIEEIEAFLAL